MNWGHKVIIILVVFIAGIISMVYISMQQTNEVVDTNYYEREMKYQEVIDGKKNLQALQDSVLIENDGRLLKIVLPALSVTRLDSGSIQFLKLSDSKDDQLIPMKSDKGGLYQIPLSDLRKGWYKLRIEWRNAGTGYYHEQNYNVQK